VLFELPKYKIKERVWFLTDKDEYKFGEINLITLALTEDSCNTYYHILDERNEEHSVIEYEIIDNHFKINPKYNIGDRVTYFYTNKYNNKTYIHDVITGIEVTHKDNNLAYSYSLEDEPNYYIKEDEIIGHSDTMNPEETIMDIVNT